MEGSAALKQGRSANRKHIYFFFFGLIHCINPLCANEFFLLV